MKRPVLAAASSLALSVFLTGAALAQASGTPAVIGSHTDANGMPTNQSTPAEQAATADLNSQNGVTTTGPGAASNAQYQAQQQDYQQKLQVNQAAQADYQNKSADYQNRMAAYEMLRDRYRAERAAYHRGVWPDSTARWTLDDSTNLTGQRVQIIGGAHVGTVTAVARTPAGRVEALEVSLDSGKLVWIDRNDIRYDRGDSTVVTNLDRHDLYAMADERM